MLEENNATNEEFSIGSKLEGRYLIEKILGIGGQGLVVKALDTNNHDNPVVIKALKIDVTDKWSADKFEEERRALARLQGATGIVKLIGSGRTADGRNYTVLEFVDGKLLTDLTDDLPNNLPRVARLFQQIAAAVEYSHRNEIYHRDLKPDNIMVANPNTRNELVKIIDFGIAKQTVNKPLNIEVTSSIVGTPYYISPNALDGKPDPKADDIYALGLIAYKMVTGQYPVSTENFSFTKLRSMQQEINLYPPSEKNKSLSKTVDEVILKALSEMTSQRYESAETFGDGLGRALLQLSADKTQPLKTETKKRKVKVALFLIPAVLLMLLLGLFGLWKIFNSNESPEIAADTPVQHSNRDEVNISPIQNANLSENSANVNSAPTKTSAPAGSLIQSSTSSDWLISPSDLTVKVVKKAEGNESVPASAAENFQTGDGIRLNIASEKNGFLQIFLKDNGGKTQKVLSSEINAGKIVSFPSPRWLFFDDKPGTETIYVVVSKSDLTEKNETNSIETQSNGRTEFSTEKGSAVKIIKLNHQPLR